MRWWYWCSVVVGGFGDQSLVCLLIVGWPLDWILMALSLMALSLWDSVRKTPSLPSILGKEGILRLRVSEEGVLRLR